MVIYIYNQAQWKSLKYKIRRIARTRAAITEPIIILFRPILRDIDVRIFLLLSMTSSTPWSCKRKQSNQILGSAWHVIYLRFVNVKVYMPLCVHAEVSPADDANHQGLRHQALPSPVQPCGSPWFYQLTDSAYQLMSSVGLDDLQQPANFLFRVKIAKPNSEEWQL